MADQRTYRRIIPLEPGQDLELLRWLTRESFETTAANDACVVVDYSERDVPFDEIPPEVVKRMRLPVRRYRWREYVAIAQRPDRPTPDPVCGYCPHPVHPKTGCPEHAVPPATAADGQPAPCPCTIDVAALKL